MTFAGDFAAIMLDPESGTGDAPPECPQFDQLEVQEEVGVAYEADGGSQAVELRVAAGDQTDQILATLGEATDCPDIAYTDEDGVAFDIKFDRVDIPAGQGLALTGTAGGFAFASHLAAFQAGGRLVTISVLGIGGLPDGVEIADLVQLTVDRGNGDAPPAADAPTLAAPGETPDTGDDDGADTARGSRDNPMTVGQATQVGDWDVTVDEIDLDATDRVTSANEYNDPPKNGNYALVTITTTYLGDGDGNAGFDLKAVLSGDDRRQYADTDCQASLPDAMFDQPTVENGGTVTGQFCIDYPDSAVGDAAGLFVEATLSFDETRRFWTLP